MFSSGFCVFSALFVVLLWFASLATAFFRSWCFVLFCGVVVSLSSRCLLRCISTFLCALCWIILLFLFLCVALGVLPPVVLLLAQLFSTCVYMITLC